jgi:hypothetical protein
MKLIVTGFIILLSNAAFAQENAHTPSAGSPERKAIMDVMRLDFYPGNAEAARTNPKGILFKVTFLKVHGDWACTSVDPTDGTGKQIAEPRWGLLRRKAGKWSDMNYFDALRPFPSEEAAQDALGMTTPTIAKLRVIFPDVPSDIFPNATR